jgi:starch synthase
VVASDVGGIPEVVVDGETGLLVHYDPAEPAAFEAGLAAAVDDVVSDLGRARDMGLAGRRRAEVEFSWERIAGQTVEVYESVLGPRP